MNILAIDTSTENLEIALKTEKGSLSFTLKMGLRHSVTLLPWIEKLLDEAEISPKNINLIVCALGPGSFTGLRIGLATAKGIAMGNGASIIGIPTLDFMANHFDFFDGCVIPVINAKKQRFYSAVYANGKRESDYLDIPREAFPEYIKNYQKVLFTGPAGGTIYNFFDRNFPEMRNSIFYSQPSFSSPFSLLELGEKRYNINGGDRIENLVPLYLRKSEAEIKKFGESKNVR